MQSIALQGYDGPEIYPVLLGVTAVGKDMVRDARYFRLATRICAELGAQISRDYEGRTVLLVAVLRGAAEVTPDSLGGETVEDGKEEQILDKLIQGAVLAVFNRYQARAQEARA